MSLARRDENWKKLQQYILDEREQVEVRGPAHISLWGERRDYTWYIRDGFFVRSPVKVNGVAIGEVSGYGRVVIDDPTPNDDFTPEVTNYSWVRQTGTTGTEQTWGGTDFRFRAVGGTYKITIYGSGVGLVASGQGTVVLTGSPDAPKTDGRYSLNGQDFKSLPTTPTKQLRIFIPTTSPTG